MIFEAESELDAKTTRAARPLVGTNDFLRLALWISPLMPILLKTFDNSAAILSAAHAVA